jgi:hypothetical protein
VGEEEGKMKFNRGFPLEVLRISGFLDFDIGPKYSCNFGCSTHIIPDISEMKWI